MEKQLCDTCTLKFDNLAKVCPSSQLLWLALTQPYSGRTRVLPLIPWEKKRIHTGYLYSFIHSFSIS